MKKDLSEESFKAIEDAAKRILDVYGKQAVDAARVEYQAGDLIFTRGAHSTRIFHEGNEVFRTLSAWSSTEKPFFNPYDWIDEVERIAQSIQEAKSE